MRIVAVRVVAVRAVAVRVVTMTAISPITHSHPTPLMHRVLVVNRAVLSEAPLAENKTPASVRFGRPVRKAACFEAECGCVRIERSRCASMVHMVGTCGRDGKALCAKDAGVQTGCASSSTLHTDSCVGSLECVGDFGSPQLW